MMHRQFIKLLKPFKKTYIIISIITVLITITGMLSPLVIRFTLDYVLGAEQGQISGISAKIVSAFGGIQRLRENIWICIVLILIISLVNNIMVHIRSRLTSYGAEEIAKKHKDDLYNHLQSLPYDYHVKAQTGDLIQRCTSDVDTVRRFLATQFIDVLRIISLTVFTLAVMVTLNIRLAFASILMMPIIFCFSNIFLKKIRQSFQIAEITEGELSTVLQENLTGVRVVRAFGREAFELSKFKTKNKELRKQIYTCLNQMAIYWGFTDFLCFSQIGLVMIAGTHMAYRGEISVGTLVLFTMYVSNLVFPFRQLGRIISGFGRTEVALQRINEILNTPIETDTPGAVAVSLQGDIVFDKVSFGYERDKKVLKEVSLKVKKGETIGILGPTGSGKSSLMHLFLRLYDYNEGSIKMNGTELRNIEKKHLRERIGIVLQEPFLYSKSIRENIKMAKEVVTDEEIYDACKIASVHHVIEEFNEGYETLVGERGVTLSGGQKQRVAIARTLVKNSDILIFDDSLSAVDTQTDAKIRAALNVKSQGITTLIISQRITTLMHADRIFVLEDGMITAQGTHKELIEKEGLYQRIWDIQNSIEEQNIS